MCTSIIVNKKKTIVGWNLDLATMEHRITTSKKGVYIEVLDETEGWMPLFGANSRGEFVAMPTCWPHDARSNPKDNEQSIIMLDIDLLLEKKTFAEIKEIVENSPVCSVPGLTFMGSLTDKDGNILYIIPGQGYQYFTKPKYKVLTNFSPFKMNEETHPYMGWDRYETANKLLEESSDDFDINDCFKVLQAVSQTVCPTVVSMVFDVGERIVYWCENREFNNIKSYQLDKEFEVKTNGK